jgi:hypothetical protein
MNVYSNLPHTLIPGINGYVIRIKRNSLLEREEDIYLASLDEYRYRIG